MAVVDTVTDAADTVTDVAPTQGAELTVELLAVTLAERHAVMPVALLEADTAAQHAADSLVAAEPVAGSAAVATAVAADTGNTSVSVAQPQIAGHDPNKARLLRQAGFVFVAIASHY
jgi:hypothetical protein